MKQFLLALVLFSCNVTSAQKADSLFAAWENTAASDSNRFAALNQFVFPLIFTEKDSALVLIEMMRREANQKGMSYWKGAAINMKGILSAVEGNNSEAIAFFETCVDIYTQLDEKVQLSKSYNNIGNVYRSQGHYSRAIEYFIKASEVLKGGIDDNSEAILNNNIGILFKEMGQLDQAEHYYRKSLAYHISKGSKSLSADVLNNLGTVYKQNGQLDSAKANFIKSIEWYEETGQLKNASNSYLNLADIFMLEKNYPEVARCINAGAEIANQMGEKPVQSNALAARGRLMLALGKIDSAVFFCLEGYARAKSSEIKPNIVSNCECLYQAYEAKNDDSNAYKYYKEYVDISDFLSGEETNKEVQKKQFQFEMQKQELADSVQRVEAKKVFDATLSAERSQQYALYGAIAFLVLIALLIWRSFRLKKRDNIIISQQKMQVEKQKELVEEKNKEVLDSITYARRLQEAILPPMRLFENWLPLSFVFYQPKDIVAGDFYWMEKVDEVVYFAAADCTGHGVPGAMVSVICSNALSKSLLEDGITKPSLILARTRELVIERFGRSEEEVTDGMDISLCAWNPKTRVLNWAGANSPLWIHKKNSPEILEIKADKQPIGNHAKETAFTNHEIKLDAGDAVYVFSDGYYDQFGGEKGKKYKSGNLRQFILSIANSDMKEQGERLANEFESWKGEIEQIDDVCVIGVRL